MSFVYKCNCVEGNPTKISWTQYRVVEVTKDKYCKDCGHMAVAFSTQKKHPRGKGIGGWQPIASPRTLTTQGYTYAAAVLLNGMPEWKVQYEFPEHYGESERHYEDPEEEV